MDFKPGGLLGAKMVDISEIAQPHPWKTEFIVPLTATPQQLNDAATVMAFQTEIDLIDTSWLDEQ